MDLYFNTINKSKIREVNYLFKLKKKYVLHFLDHNITEILNPDIEYVIKEKVKSAYTYWRIPIIVEHGALEIEYFNKFPGALSKPMWDMMNDRICDLIPKSDSRRAKVISSVCYCNGKIIKSFRGETQGTISSSGKGKNGFQFDPIFIPDGSSMTYAQMNLEEKMALSQATKSYSQLIKFLDNI